MSTCATIMTSPLLSSTHFIQVAEGVCMLLKLSVVPDSCTATLWFEDRHLQELLVLAHQLVYTASQSFSLTASSKTAQLNFTRSSSMRVLYRFEEQKVRQSLLQFSGHGSNLPNVTITSNYGKRVFPCDTATGKDHTYKSYRLLPTTLVMYVDHFELPSPLGVIKIRKGLDPSYTLIEDITLYFKVEECAISDQSGPLTKVPLNQLKRQQKRKSSCPKKREDLPKPVPSSSSTADSGPSIYRRQLTIPVALAINKAGQEVASKDNELPSCEDSLIPPVPEDLLDELLLAVLTPTNSQPVTPTDHQSVTDLSLPSPTNVRDTSVQTINSPKDCSNLTVSQQPQKDLLDDLFTVDITDCDQSPQKHESVCDESLTFSEIVDLTDEPEITTAVDAVSDAQSQKLEKKIQEVSCALFRGYSEIKDIPILNIRKWLKFRKKTLVEIYSGKRPSERHSKFKDTSSVRRNKVLQNAVNTAMLSQEQLDALSSDVINMFCTENESEFTYAWLVMFPEALVYLHMDFFQIDYKEAEERMYSFTTYKETDTDL